MRIVGMKTRNIRFNDRLIFTFFIWWGNCFTSLTFFFFFCAKSHVCLFIRACFISFQFVVFIRLAFLCVKALLHSATLFHISDVAYPLWNMKENKMQRHHGEHRCKFSGVDGMILQFHCIYQIPCRIVLMSRCEITVNNKEMRLYTSSICKQ